MSESKKQSLWAFDPVVVKHVDVADNNVTFELLFLDFLGIQKVLKVSRSDCYFNFIDKVLKPMVDMGYRYNTSIANAPVLIQTAICAFRPNPETVQKAIEAWQKSNKSQGEANTEVVDSPVN